MRWSNRSKYVLYISILHLVLIGLVYKLLNEDKPLFIASEIFLLLSAVASIQLYRNFMQPIEFVRSGIEAIKDQDFSIKFVSTGKGEVDTLIEVYNLMIDQLREERTRLHEQHFFLEKLIEASPISIIIFDFDGRIAVCNEQARTQFGKEKLVGLLPEETGYALLADMTQIPDGESRILKTNGIATFKVQRSHFMDRGFNRSFFMIEELTSEILESEKNAYGKVIRMMAHEVNNTLGATDSILQTAQGYQPAEDYTDIRDALQIASDRNRQLTRFMRNFADVVRLPAPMQEETELNGFTSELGRFMEPLAARRGVHIRCFLSSEKIVKRMDRAQMEQVLVNVVKNAIEACRPGQEIRLVISETSLEVMNNGKSIDPETASQLFNPFFSTKRDGQGIGLTLTREILLNHGFAFSLATRQDGWTVFQILFS